MEMGHAYNFFVLLAFPGLILSRAQCALQKVNVDDSYGVGRNFDGIGAISGGGATSKLLVNYPEAQRNQVLDFLFKPNFGASLQILKVEIGGDSQSTDGVESSHMHTEVDVSFQRGYEWWMMKEAKKRNPNIKLYGLPWVFPGWLGNGTFNPYAMREKLVYYITSWIKGAAKVHNLQIDYIGIWNERSYDIDYIKMLRKSLDNQGFSHTQIVAADGGWGIASDVLKDPDLANAVSILGAHYPGSMATADAQKTGKKLWASEEYSAFNNLAGGGCWARVLSEGYVNGNLTSAIAWNLISSYSAALPYSGSGLMTANQPWSGYYVVNTPIWMSAHYTQFTEIGWSYLDHGHGSGHLDSNGSYIALTSPDRSQLTIVIENMDPHDAPCFYPMPKYTVAPQTVTFTLKGSFSKIQELDVWFTHFNFTQGGHSDIFIYQGPMKVVNGSFSLTVMPNVVITLTTVKSGRKGQYPAPPPPAPFPLPYKDTFQDYAEFSEPYNLAPQAGSFEIRSSSEPGITKVLRQVVPQPPIDTCLPKRMPRPIAVIGNHSWADVRVEITCRVPASNGSSGVFIASRVSSGGCSAMYSNGLYFWLLLGERKFLLSSDYAQKVVYANGTLPNSIDFNTWTSMSLFAQGKKVRGMLNSKDVFNLELKTVVSAYGFVAIGTNDFGMADFINMFIDKT
ncbi:galactocerebrosidase-like [Lingula anatina]|uniref:galactosylceramidase n=1 Tax=Lingula anatina TaxID=7574 RepID=A0A1S3ISW1_LINAN|nr:galactocerebrosidase-like [Lingula anatina]|eukprot:XP_013401026.1 galactocerebrosidase-like [Lingula anatina]